MINIKVRLQSKTWLLSMLAAVVAFGYQLAGLLGYVPPIAEDQVTQLVGLVVNILVGLGIVVDPTTKGIGDSTRAMQYERPGGR